MQRDGPPPKTAEWFRRGAQRNERARVERLRIDGRKSVGQNIEEGAALIALGFEVRRGSSRSAGDEPGARRRRSPPVGYTSPESSTW